MAEIFSYKNCRPQYEPYPVFYLENFISPEFYNSLEKQWPPLELFQGKPNLGSKYSLSERNNSVAYRRFIRSSKSWWRLHRFIKSQDFLNEILSNLRRLGVDLNLSNPKVIKRKHVDRALSKLMGFTPVWTRFEFSMMHCHQGNIRPHTDDPNKLITLVVSMNPASEWNRAWGGGTEICLPKDRSLVYNELNRYLEFDAVDILSEFPYKSNQCIFFVKTYNSWHQVSPLRGPEDGPFRKTLTINIEVLR